MDKILNWFHTYDVEISWFIIGFLTSAALESLSRGRWISTLVYVAIIALNVFISLKKKNVAR